ncbi:FAD-dependent oxidoreductase [Nodosilinea sp. P-1105]|uniref:flavin-containing monooxygenase n=1 Tax=Nodosilinea sp. P-1105 TaxID=2546229 RepID=UPI00146E272E|nr:FAD-dependent oxidoreductase [Nodosilinea sp. P-1105]NMF85955.1 FAD-binding protein [Nodosilinea sp. P-1105]
MSTPSKQRVAVIGAGVAGLVSAKVLKQDGFDVTVFEKASTMGGVWAKSRAYPGLRTNNPRETYAFSDFDYPETADEFPTAEQVRAYLEAYAEHFGITPHIRLGTEVISVARRRAESSLSHPGFRLEVQPGEDAAAPEVHDVDWVVVCNGVFSVPHIPQLQGQETFAGWVFHSSQLSHPEIIRGQRVIVVGAGKSALDCATFAAHEAASSTLVFRKPHWMVPRYFSDIRVDRVLFNRFSEQIFPTYHSASSLERALRWGATPLIGLWKMTVSYVVKRLSHIPDAMVPAIAATDGLENNGIGAEFYGVLQQGLVHIKSAQIVAYSGPDTVQLDTGEQLEADGVIFATGWQQRISFLSADLLQKIQKEGWFQLYRHILPPEEPNLGFIGYAASGNTPLTAEISAHWLSQWFRGELKLPDSTEMEREIAKVRRWTQAVFPRRHEGYFIGAYISHYIDQLMQDMGLPTHRTDNWFSEYWGPFWASRYRSLAKERQQLRINCP